MVSVGCNSRSAEWYKEGSTLKDSLPSKKGEISKSKNNRNDKNNGRTNLWAEQNMAVEPCKLKYAPLGQPSLSHRRRLTCTQFSSL